MLYSNPPPSLASLPHRTAAELFAQRQQKLVAKKEGIAEMASFLMEDPEENVSQ